MKCAPRIRSNVSIFRHACGKAQFRKLHSECELPGSPKHCGHVVLQAHDSNANHGSVYRVQDLYPILADQFLECVGPGAPILMLAAVSSQHTVHLVILGDSWQITTGTPPRPSKICTDVIRHYPTSAEISGNASMVEQVTLLISCVKSAASQ